ncbi:hypothetical protein ACOBWA_01330 [Psychrobacter sp. ER1]|uniref:hypothetical protein n=1 Tax=Psychrobacter sp. ER1 TaxID=3406645 RepID=UPI003B4352F6
MNNFEQDNLQNIERKSQARSGKEQKPEPLSAFNACVLRKSAKIHELSPEA